MYKVYYLPNCNYCGVTSRDIVKRLWEHRYIFNRDTSNHVVLAEFNNKKEAYEYEKKYQLDNNVDGYIYTDEWREIQSEKLLNNPLHIKRQKKVLCIDTEILYSSLRECARAFDSSHANLSKHLKGHKSHGTFCKLKFEYYEE